MSPLIDASSNIIQAKVIQESDPSYHQLRKVWNGFIDHKPKFIVQCTSVHDVIDAIRLAKQENLKISVRAGGHSVAGHAMIDKGLVIDVSNMKHISFNKQHSAIAEAGLLGAEFDFATQQVGLATPLGTVSHTGIAGLTIGGGYGWLSRKFGLACDNLLAVNVVTTNGDYIRIDNSNYSDLFWAIKGGGGNFAVVTSFEYKLYQIGPEIFGGLILYPLSAAREILKLYFDFTSQCSNEFTSYLYFFHYEQNLVCCLTFFCHDKDEGLKALAPFRKISPSLLDTIQVRSYLSMQQLIDHHAPHGLNYYWRANYMDEQSDITEVINTILKNLEHISSKQSLISIEQVGGAISAKTCDETAFFHRDAMYNFLICSAWTNKHESQQHINYANTFWTDMLPFFRQGSYQNYNGECRSHPEAIYGSNFEKLQHLKNKYDPTNLVVGNYAFGS